MDLASKISGADPTPIRVYNECVNQSNASNKSTSNRVTSGADPTPIRVYKQCVNQSKASNKSTSNRVTTCFVIYNNNVDSLFLCYN